VRRKKEGGEVGTGEQGRLWEREEKREAIKRGRRERNIYKIF
jgi:hypothetical protein